MKNNLKYTHLLESIRDHVVARDLPTKNSTDLKHNLATNFTFFSLEEYVNLQFVKIQSAVRYFVFKTYSEAELVKVSSLNFKLHIRRCSNLPVCSANLIRRQQGGLT